MSSKSIQTQIVRSESHDPWFNLAAEEYLLNHLSPSEVILYLWQNDQTVVIGRNQNAWKECDWERLEKDGGKLARRLSGGGTVFHDLGNLNFTFLLSKRNYDLEKQLSVILNALKSLQVNAEFSGRNDLLLDGKKFSGHAYYYQGQSAYHHGTILIRSDLEKLGRYLQPSQKKMVSKGVDSVRSRVVNLAEVDARITVPIVMDCLAESFAECYGEPIAKKIIHEQDPEILLNYPQYASWEWRFGQTPVFDLTISERFTWGEIELGLRLKNGKIDSCTVFSDAMDEEFIRRIPEILKGHLLEKENLIGALESLSGDGPEVLMVSDLVRWIRGLQI